MLNPDFQDMLFALSDAKIDFLLVGAYAALPAAIYAQLVTSIIGFDPMLKLRQGYIVFSPNSVPTRTSHPNRFGSSLAIRGQDTVGLREPLRQSLPSLTWASMTGLSPV